MTFKPRILVIYSSFDGQTTRIAQRIGEICSAAGHDVTVRSTEMPGATYEIGTHDAVIVGGAIRYGRFSRSLESVVRDNARLLDGIPHAFFCVCLAATRPAGAAKVAAWIEAFTKRTDWHPRSATAFAGALPYRRFNPLLRFMMRMISGAAGGDTDTSRDYEYTDWAAVERFAMRFAERLPAVAAA